MAESGENSAKSRDFEHLLDDPGNLFSTTRQWAKKQVNLEVTSKARTQAFGATTYRKRLEDKPLEAPRFSAGF
jgi:hypothetical protein